VGLMAAAVERISAAEEEDFTVAAVECTLAVADFVAAVASHISAAALAWAAEHVSVAHISAELTSAVHASAAGMRHRD
jgi:hypothetical protein